MTHLPSPSEEHEFFRQRGFGLRIGFGKRPALLVIDMINAFTDPSMMLGADLDGPIEATRQMLQVAHDKGVPVLFSTVSYSEPGQKDAGIWAYRLMNACNSLPATPCWSKNTLHAFLARIWFLACSPATSTP